MRARVRRRLPLACIATAPAEVLVDQPTVCARPSSPQQFADDDDDVHDARSLTELTVAVGLPVRLCANARMCARLCCVFGFVVRLPACVCASVRLSLSLSRSLALSLLCVRICVSVCGVCCMRFLQLASRSSNLYQLVRHIRPCVASFSSPAARQLFTAIVQPRPVPRSDTTPCVVTSEINATDYVDIFLNLESVLASPYDKHTQQSRASYSKLMHPDTITPMISLRSISRIHT